MKPPETFGRSFLSRHAWAGAEGGLFRAHSRLLRRLISLLDMLAELRHDLLGEQHH
jgi:hypothetical protein